MIVSLDQSVSTSSNALQSRAANDYSAHGKLSAFRGIWIWLNIISGCELDSFRKLLCKHRGAAHQRFLANELLNSQFRCDGGLFFQFGAKRRNVFNKLILFSRFLFFIVFLKFRRLTAASRFRSNFAQTFRKKHCGSQPPNASFAAKTPGNRTVSSAQLWCFWYVFVGSELSK